MYVTYTMYDVQEASVVRRLKEAHADATRRALLAAARSVFSEVGYATSRTEDIVRKAGVTRGALYHHFRDKRELFRAVFEELETELVAGAGARASAAADSWTNLLAGYNGFLDACLQRDLQRIVLLDGPSVLGRETWRKIEEEHALAVISAGLSAVMRDGFIDQQPVAPLAHLLLATINEAGLLIAEADDTAATRVEVGAAFEALLAGLRVKPTSALD